MITTRPILNNFRPRHEASVLIACVGAFAIPQPEFEILVGIKTLTVNGRLRH